MTTTIRLHAFAGTELGTTSCDFRGDKFIGDKQGDHHKTLFEKDVDDTDPLVAETLEIGPQINALFGKLEAVEVASLGEFGQVLDGNVVGFRIGVWDKVAPV